MKSRFTGGLNYFYLVGAALIIAVGFLPVTLPSTNDIYVPNSPQRYPIAPLTRGTAVTQQFPAAAGKIDSLSLFFGTYQHANAGTLQMDMRADRDGGWTTLATQTVEKSSLRDNAYYTFVFSPPLPVSAGERLQVVLRSAGPPEQAVTILATRDWNQPPGYQLAVSDAPQPGTALFRASYAPASGRVFEMLGSIWRRSTVLLSAPWQIVLGIALAALLGGIVALGRRLAPEEMPPGE